MSRWIVRTRLRPVHGALEDSVGNRSHRWHTRDALVLALDDGHSVALGEASPLPGFSPDTLDECARALQSIHALLGPAPDEPSPESVVRAMMAPAAVERLRATPAARFAVETALWSWARARAVDGTTSAERRLLASNESVQRSALLGGGSLDPEQWADAARARLRRGRLGAIKLKVGREDLAFERELAGVRAVRDVVPSEMELRVDANGAWDADTARAKVRALADHGASSVEEPCSGDELLRLGRCAIPWLADESLTNPLFGARALAAPGCGGLVLKPALLGGVLVCIDLLRLAAARGLRCALSHLFDGPLALRMATELASASPLLPLPSALGWHEGLEAWPRRLRRSAPDPLGEGPPWVFYALSPSEWGLSIDAVG